jgi:hypothetical protein
MLGIVYEIVVFVHDKTVGVLSPMAIVLDPWDDPKYRP